MKLGQWIGLIAIVLSLYIVWQIREELLLIFAAVVLSTTLNRLARLFQNWGIRRGLAVVLSIGIFFAIIICFFLLVVPPFADQFQEATKQFPRSIQRINIWLGQLSGRVPPQFQSYLTDINNLSKQVQPILNRLVGSSLAFVSGSLEALLKTLLVLVLSGMFLANPQAYRKLFIRLFPSFYRRRVDGILDECEVSLEGWVIGALIAMGIVGLLSMLGLWVLQVPVALALGILAGFLNLIPNIGPTLSVVPAMAIAFSPDAPWRSIAVLVLYFIIQQLESNFITPIVMAHQVSLLPAVTLISQLFFLYFFGFLGLLLALPLTVVAKIWFREVIVEDILDRWQAEPKRETEYVIISEQPDKHLSASHNIDAENSTIDAVEE